MKREYYSDTISNFRNTSATQILGELVTNSEFAVEGTERHAWLEEIRILKEVLSDIEGSVYFEYSIPRMGKRIDAVLLIGPVIFVLEFKIGEREFTSYALNQVWDYARTCCLSGQILDLAAAKERQANHNWQPAKLRLARACG